MSPWLSAPPGGSAHNIGCGVCSARNAARTARPGHRCTTILLSATSLPMHQISCGSAILLSIRAREGKLYICAIKDVFSNRIVGYCMDSRMKSRLATTALHNAVARRGEVAGCVLHTDRGSQFRSRKFVHALGRQEMVGSMGESGLPATTPPWRASSACCKRTCWIAAAGTPARNCGSRSSPGSNAPTTDADAKPRAVDPDRIRSNHHHTGHPGRVTETVTNRCSRPERLELVKNTLTTYSALDDDAAGKNSPYTSCMR